MSHADRHSCIYRGNVMHHRFSPRPHRFVYRVGAWLIDLDELPTLHKSLRGFSWNRLNLFSFYDRDHGETDGSDLREYAEKICVDNGVAAPKKVRLLCYPRILGYAFNPLSIYFCSDANGKAIATIYEVRNTFKQRHTYLIAEQQGSLQSVLRHRAKKVFYVSPFIPVEGEYHFRLRPPEAHILVGIRHTQKEHTVLNAVFTGQRKPLNNKTLLMQFLQMPFMTIKIIAMIHWEALRVWIKGASYVSRPSPPSKTITLGQCVPAATKQVTR